MKHEPSGNSAVRSAATKPLSNGAARRTEGTVDNSGGSQMVVEGSEEETPGPCRELEEVVKIQTDLLHSLQEPGQCEQW